MCVCVGRGGGGGRGEGWHFPLVPPRLVSEICLVKRFLTAHH